MNISRFFLCCSLCFITASISAQATFSWGINGTPNFSHRRLIAQDVIDRPVIDSLEALEIARFSYSAGLHVRWRTDRVGFQTGLNFVNSGHRTQRVLVESSDPAPPNADEKRTVYQHLLIEAPAELYFFQEIDEKNDFFFMMGLSFAYMLNNSANIIFYNGESSDVVTATEDGRFSSINYSFLTGMGWEHDFNERFSLSLQPTFQFWLRPLFNDISVPLNRNLYAVGLRASLLFTP
jgi:hypothetical protein